MFDIYFYNVSDKDPAYSDNSKFTYSFFTDHFSPSFCDLFIGITCRSFHKLISNSS